MRFKIGDIVQLNDEGIRTMASSLKERYKRERPPIKILDRDGSWHIVHIFDLEQYFKDEHLEPIPVKKTVQNIDYAGMEEA